MTDLLADILPPVTLGEQIACIERELRLRRQVYTRWVDRGRMRQSEADEELRRMEAVLATLQAVEARGVSP